MEAHSGTRVTEVSAIGRLVARDRLLDLGLIFLVVTAFCLVGIWSRPAGILASLWPANAALLGLFVRIPRLPTRPLNWVAAAAAYLFADLVTGSTVEKAVWLNAANLVGVGVGTLAFRRLKPIDRRIGRPISINLVFLACIAASAGAAVVGSGANMNVFGGTLREGAEIWFTAELSNYTAFIPLLLAAPGFALTGERRNGWFREVGELLRPAILPLAALVASFAIWRLLESPFLIALPIPVLLWCALRAGVFATCLLILLATSWTMLLVGNGFLQPLEVGSGGSGLPSFQLILALVSMGPIAVASSLDARERALDKLRVEADRDELTGALSRTAFLRRSDELLEDLIEAGRPVAVLMMDLDHFKEINDTYGHAAGDAVLAAFGGMTSSTLRDTDLFGRVGGEEFAVLLPGISKVMAAFVSERIRSNLVENPIEIEETWIEATVSIGYVHGTATGTLDELLKKADSALYDAKLGGRNQVVEVRPA